MMPILIAAIAASTLLGGTTLAQHGGRAQGSGRPAGTPARPAADRPVYRDETPRPQQLQRPDQAPRPVQDRTPAHPQPPLSLAERLQQQPQFHRQLGLTPTQGAAVARICEQQRNEIQAINQRWLMTRAQKDRRIRDSMEKHDAEIRALLQPEQRHRMEQFETQDHDRLRAQPNHP